MVKGVGVCLFLMYNNKVSICVTIGGIIYSGGAIMPAFLMGFRRFFSYDAYALTSQYDVRIHFVSMRSCASMGVFKLGRTGLGV